MTLIRLDVQSLRNLRDVSIEPGPGFNLITGANGSGKTSLLESLHLLGLGRSFRTTRAQRLIMDDMASCVVHARLQDDTSLGVRKSRTEDSLARINGETVPLASLAHALPLQLIDPLSLDMLAGPSQPRRQLLDWGVFHVEPAFMSVWQRAQRALQQRNSLLKSARISDQELSVWEQELAQSAELITAQRAAFFARWQPVLLAAMGRLLPDVSITASWQPGWDVDQPLQVLLRDSRARDIERGFTHQGPHRADIRLRVGGMNAEERLSRGQLKMAVCAIKMSLLDLMSGMGMKPLLLVDDLAAELDVPARRRLCQWMQESGSQVWMTAIEPDALPLRDWGCDPVSRFHVEHGHLEMTT